MKWPWYKLNSPHAKLLILSQKLQLLLISKEPFIWVCSSQHEEEFPNQVSSNTVLLNINKINFTDIPNKSLSTELVLMSNTQYVIAEARRNLCKGLCIMNQIILITTATSKQYQLSYQHLWFLATRMRHSKPKKLRLVLIT